MTTRRLLACAAILVALSVAITTNAQASGLPQGPCDVDHQWDIEIIDGVLFECDCQHMMFGPPICDWMEITSQAEDPVRLRRAIRRAKAHHARVIWRVSPRRIPAPAKPVIVATPLATPAAAAGKCSDPFLADDAWAQVHGC